MAMLCRIFVAGLFKTGECIFLIHGSSPLTSQSRRISRQGCPSALDLCPRPRKPVLKDVAIVDDRHDRSCVLFGYDY